MHAAAGNIRFNCGVDYYSHLFPHRGRWGLVSVVFYLLGRTLPRPASPRVTRPELNKGKKLKKRFSKFTLVFGGGGMRALAHIGVLEVLEEASPRKGGNHY